MLRPALCGTLALLASCTGTPSPSQRDVSAAFIAANRGDYSCAEGSTYDTLRSRFFPQTTFVRQTCAYEHGRIGWSLVALDGTQAIPLGNEIGFANLLARHAPLSIVREDAAEYGLFVATLTGLLDQPFEQLASPDPLPDSLRQYFRLSTTPVLMGSPDRLAHFSLPLYHPSTPSNPGYLWRVDGSVILRSGTVRFSKVRLWEEPLPVH